jgi:hypothetical protein
MHRHMREHAGNSWQGWLRAASACFALTVTSCAASLGATGSYAPVSPASGHVGIDLQGHVPVPGSHHFIAGGYAAHLFQFHPGTAADQGRVAAVLGYSDEPVTREHPVGLETTLRLGGFRGSNGPLVELGALGLATFSPLILLSPREPGPDAGGLSGVTWVLVPLLSAGVLVPFEDVKVEPEFAAAVALRAYLCGCRSP